MVCSLTLYLQVIENFDLRRLVHAEIRRDADDYGGALYLISRSGTVTRQMNYKPWNWTVIKRESSHIGLI
jgi:hypothetical protein